MTLYITLFKNQLAHFLRNIIAFYNQDQIYSLHSLIMVHPLLLIRYHSNLTLGYPFSHSQNKAHSRSLPSHITLFWRVALILIVWKWFFLKWGLAQKRKSFPDHHKVLEIMIKVGSAKSWWESVIAIMKKVWSCLKEVLLSALILIKCDHEKGALISVAK